MPQSSPTIINVNIVKNVKSSDMVVQEPMKSTHGLLVVLLSYVLKAMVVDPSIDNNGFYVK